MSYFIYFYFNRGNVLCQSIFKPTCHQSQRQWGQSLGQILLKLLCPGVKKEIYQWPNLEEDHFFWRWRDEHGFVANISDFKAYLVESSQVISSDFTFDVDLNKSSLDGPGRQTHCGLSPGNPKVGMLNLCCSSRPTSDVLWFKIIQNKPKHYFLLAIASIVDHFIIDIVEIKILLILIIITYLTDTCEGWVAQCVSSSSWPASC